MFRKNIGIAMVGNLDDWRGDGKHVSDVHLLLDDIVNFDSSNKKIVSFRYSKEVFMMRENILYLKLCINGKGNTLVVLQDVL